MGMCLERKGSIVIEVNLQLGGRCDFHREGLLSCNGRPVMIGGEPNSRILFYRNKRNEHKALLVSDIALDYIRDVAEGRMEERILLLDFGVEVIFCGS